MPLLVPAMAGSPLLPSCSPPSPPAAHAAGLAATRTRARSRRCAAAGASSGAYVVDLDTGEQLYACAPTRARMPASVEKLYTTATALLRFGAGGTLDHRACSATALLDADGDIAGDLFLRGGGDPTFGARHGRARSPSSSAATAA